MRRRREAAAIWQRRASSAGTRRVSSDPLPGRGWLVSGAATARSDRLTYARRSARPRTAQREPHAEAIDDPRSDRAGATTGPMTRAAA
jgi:hypothetical protein